MRLGPVHDSHTWGADAAYIDITAAVPFERSKYHDRTGYEKTISTRRSATSRTPPSAAGFDRVGFTRDS
ncbi:hypothetical protein AB0L64_05525 [Kribbella sp. NPDC051936]|uniref:hypothetical protein n=1 Tax=Kribbella sp. NPDC051936 TaxID=3154946 RepID=UPI003446DF04